MPIARELAILVERRAIKMLSMIIGAAHGLLRENRTDASMENALLGFDLSAGCSLAGDGVVNEDFFGWTQKAAWVLDGATGVSDEKLPYPSDAYWFVRTFSRFLDFELLTTPEAPTLDIMNRAIASTRNKYLEGSANSDRSSTLAPSAAFVMVRMLGGAIEIASLGDCKALFTDETGDTRIFYDDSLEPFENRTQIALREIRKYNPDLSHAELVSKLTPFMKENRQKMNQPDGYRILSLTEINVDDLNIQRAPLNAGDSLALMSDGFLRYTETFELGNYTDLFERVQKNPLLYVADDVRGAENADPECRKYIRVKKSDDATCVVVKLK
ncbi:MAG: protein phosphatase 2C domain-containing protein [Alphaproteobacteria bacterium]|nr:protein phosphatase 2C domain-containing protein [Alphaproteobacteria bacterium]